MDKNVNFFEFSDPSEGIQGVIQLEPEKKVPQKPVVEPVAAVPDSKIEKYRVFCDVDTEVVLHRLKKALWPFDRRKFLETKADLYGAFWVPTTLIFIISVSGSISSHFSQSAGYTFNPSAIITIASLIYFFIFSVPALLSFVILNGIEITFSELMSLYGYSYFIFWFSAIISIFQYHWLRWLSFGIASVWAGVLLTKNFYSEIESLEGIKKYVALGISFSGYLTLTITANLYLYT